MKPRDFLRTLRRRWILILGAVAAALALASLITVLATPQYASSSRVFISSPASSSPGGSTPDAAGLAETRRVTSYASLVTDGELAQRVVDKMNLDISAPQLADKVTAQVVPDTVLLEIQVTDADPRTAQRICQQVVQQLQGLIAEIETPPGKSAPLLKGTLVGPASLPTSAVSPDWVRNLLLGGLLGLLLGLALAVIRRRRPDTSLKSSQDVEDAVGAPLLGSIAFDPGTPNQPLVTSLSALAPRAEAFGLLRTNLQFVDIDAVGKVYAVTSSVPGEGTSTTAVNVAITMAQAGQRVLLVEGDLRRPQVADMLGLENGVGVTTVLLGDVDVAHAIQDHRESGLKVLASGAVPPNPSELLQSRALGQLLAGLRQEFDTVIINSPPLLSVTDAALLARQTDGAVVVVRHGQTSREQLGSSAQRLTAAGGVLLGVVFNRVPAAVDAAPLGARDSALAPVRQTPAPAPQLDPHPVSALDVPAAALPMAEPEFVFPAATTENRDVEPQPVRDPWPAGSDPLESAFDLEPADDQPTPASGQSFGASRDENNELDSWPEEQVSTGSLLDEFLTEDSDLSDERSYADAGESDGDRVGMWRPSRWIGN